MTKIQLTLTLTQWPNDLDMVQMYLYTENKVLALVVQKS